MDDKKFINLGLLTPVERHAWDIAIAVAKEAGARYGMRLYVSVSLDELGCKLSAVDLTTMYHGSQIVSYEALEDAAIPQVLADIMKEGFLRQFAERRT